MAMIPPVLMMDRAMVLYIFTVVHNYLGECSGDLDAFRFFFKSTNTIQKKGENWFWFWFQVKSLSSCSTSLQLQQYRIKNIFRATVV